MIWLDLIWSYQRVEYPVLNIPIQIFRMSQVVNFVYEYQMDYRFLWTVVICHFAISAANPYYTTKYFPKEFAPFARKKWSVDNKYLSTSWNVALEKMPLKMIQMWLFYNEIILCYWWMLHSIFMWIFLKSYSIFFYYSIYILLVWNKSYFHSKRWRNVTFFMAENISNASQSREKL